MDRAHRALVRRLDRLETRRREVKGSSSEWTSLIS